MSVCLSVSNALLPLRLTGQHRQELSRLAETDPEFYQFLAENDQELLDFNASEGEEEEGEGEGEEGLEEMGTPEAVPKEITSRRPEVSAHELFIKQVWVNYFDSCLETHTHTSVAVKPSYIYSTVTAPTTTDQRLHGYLCLPFHPLKLSQL